MSKGVVASDSVKNRFDDRKPNGVAALSVAVAVDDIDSFNTDYEAIVSEYIDTYGMQIPHPVLKDQDITRWVPDWKQADVRAELGRELLNIDAVETVQIAETSLDHRWIHLYTEDDQNAKRLSGPEFVNSVLSSYYNIISIWKYLENGHGQQNSRPTPNRTNVLTDDFSGNTFPAWVSVNEMADSLRVIPQGDVTYPLLATADMLMGLLKQEVSPLQAKEVYEHLKNMTDAYVDADNVNDLSAITSNTDRQIRTELYYPTPTVYINRAGMPKQKLTSLDVFAHACRYAFERDGCVKFFKESLDRDFLTNEDVIVHLGENAQHLSDYDELNSTKSATVTTRDTAVEFFTSRIDTA